MPQVAPVVVVDLPLESPQAQLDINLSQFAACMAMCVDILSKLIM